MSDPINQGEKAKAILESEAWKWAWDAYRTRIFELIAESSSDDTARVMHLKRMLSAGDTARKNLEALVVDGKMALDKLKFEEEQQRLKLLPRAAKLFR